MTIRLGVPEKDKKQILHIHSNKSYNIIIHSTIGLCYYPTTPHDYLFNELLVALFPSTITGVLSSFPGLLKGISLLSMFGTFWVDGVGILFSITGCVVGMGVCGDSVRLRLGGKLSSSN